MPVTRRSHREVWITGIGLVTGLGADRESTWRGLCQGRSGLVMLDGLGLPGFAGAPAAVGAAADEPCLELLDVAAAEALGDAGLGCPHGWGWDPARAGVLVGLSKGGLRSWSRLAEAPGSGRVPAERARAWIEGGWPGAGAARIARRAGFAGPCLAPIAACATGMVAAIQGMMLVRQGVCDLVLAGAADASLEPLVLGAFQRMRVLSQWPGDPRQAVRPWDRRRSGFLVGEGAALLVLESAEHARGRGARPHAELAGGALGADAHHITDLDPDPSNLAGLIARSLADAGVAPGELDHVNVHGTATRSNDPLECAALRRVLGGAAQRVACAANKPQIGHLLGAAGAVELAFAALAVRDGFVPPTLNLDNPDPACDLDGTPHVGRARPIRAALKLALGFGGHLAATVLRRVDEGRDPIDPLA